MRVIPLPEEMFPDPAEKVTREEVKEWEDSLPTRLLLARLRQRWHRLNKFNKSDSEEETTKGAFISIGFDQAIDVLQTILNMKKGE